MLLPRLIPLLLMTVSLFDIIHLELLTSKQSYQQNLLSEYNWQALEKKWRHQQRMIQAEQIH